MRFPKASLLATASLILNTNALPKPVTYSVVNVDGGSQATPEPTIIYSTITADGKPTTVSVTVVRTPSTTAIVTDHTTDVTHVKETETALIPEVSVRPDHPPPQQGPQEPEENATVTIVSMVTPTPTTTTQYYDDGQWHTSYEVKHWSVNSQYHPGQWNPPTSCTSTSSSSSSSSAATGTGVALVSRGLPPSKNVAPGGYAKPSGFLTQVHWNYAGDW